MHPSCGINLVHRRSKWKPGWESHLCWWSMIQEPTVDLYCSRPNRGSSVRLMLSLTCVLLLNWIMKRWERRKNHTAEHCTKKAARGGLCSEGRILWLSSGLFYKRCSYMSVKDTCITLPKLNPARSKKLTVLSNPIHQFSYKRNCFKCSIMLCNYIHAL